MFKGDGVAQWLTRAGTVRRVGVDCTVVFQHERCPGCEGRCGLTIGAAAPLALDTDLPEGAAVEVAASTRALSLRALRVFGWPLSAVVIAALVVEPSTANDWLVAAVLVVTVLATVLAVRGLGVGSKQHGGVMPTHRDGADPRARVVLE